MKEQINIFFASDDRYLPYLGIALSSLSEHSSSSYVYNVNILTANFAEDNLEEIKKIVKPNIRVSVFNIDEKINSFREKLSLRLRDYYSESIYYRMFIPSLFPDIEKAVYLDSDIVLCDDVAKLFLLDIGENLLGAVTDESVICEPVFCNYVKRHIGLSLADEYFNSGVLLMNLKRMRDSDIEGKFIHLLDRYNFNTVAPDQDYLNFLCRGKIYYLPSGWNKHPIPGREISKNDLHIMHYNMFNKPWHYDGVPDSDLFWDEAKKTPFYEQMIAEKENYKDEDRSADIAGAKRLVDSAKEIFEHGESISESIEKEYFQSVRI